MANGVDKPGNLMTIDKGCADGIHGDMGCNQQFLVLLGIVYLVAEHLCYRDSGIEHEVEHQLYDSE